jgi:hypothetical protein
LKIAFDENTPAAMVRLFRGFQQEKALRRALGPDAGDAEIVTAQDYYPAVGDDDYRQVHGKVPDDPWIRRFAKDGGKAIISGDRKMLLRPHEKLALIESKLVVVFLPHPWSGWPLCAKVSLLVHWWETIARSAATLDPGLYSVPKAWPLSEMELGKLPEGDLKLEKIEAQKARQAETKARRARDRRLSGPEDLFEKRLSVE